MIASAGGGGAGLLHKINETNSLEGCSEEMLESLDDELQQDNVEAWRAKFRPLGEDRTRARRAAKDAAELSKKRKVCEHVTSVGSDSHGLIRVLRSCRLSTSSGPTTFASWISTRCFGTEGERIPRRAGRRC